MKTLGLIPARAGSKGIPRKNVRCLAGKPLLAWTIESARRSGCVDEIVVSTEDAEIAAVAKDWGADVPFVRPVEFSRDDTPSIVMVLHALSALPTFDWVLLLQPTSPLRTAEDIKGIFELCLRSGAPAAVSVCEIGERPEWMYRRNSRERLVPLLDCQGAFRRQDLPNLYVLNGSLYLARRDWLVEHRSFLSEETLGYVMPIERSPDIDNELDWAWTEFLLSRRSA